MSDEVVRGQRRGWDGRERGVRSSRQGPSAWDVRADGAGETAWREVAEPTTHAEHECMRCLCGSLLARRVPGGIELKCRRCKRVLILSLQDDEGSPS